ncbi:MAG: hypothetical protein L0Y71_05985 [Gemmataceae bacterium]|nr:hypothetical protein [Gemmataceae bacterium]
MPLAQRIQGRAHSIQNLRLSALARFREGRLLVINDRRLAGIYLWGYCVEMLLKAAYFRLKGWSPIQTITVDDMRQAKQHATQLLKCAWPGNLHYLPGWKDLLTEERQRVGTPFARSFSRSLNAQVSRLALHWSETLRYHDLRPFRGEVRVCEQATTWLVGQFRFL